MKKLIGMVALAIGMAGTGLAHAHEAKPQHGGVVVTANDVQYELVNKAGKLLIYVDDHGKPVDTTGASGKLTVLNGGKKSKFALQPENGNALAADGAVTLAPGTKAVAAITFADKKRATTRFAIK